MTFHSTIWSALVLLYGLFLLYVLMMGFYRCYLAKQLNAVLLVLGAPILLLGGIVDVLANCSLAWAIFLEPPREWLVTTRLKRYMRDGATPKWRRSMADAACAWVLNPFDPRGRHC